jgi:hypothetical protein
MPENDEQENRISGKVPNFPLTRFLITIGNPSQSRAVLEVSRKGFVDTKNVSVGRSKSDFSVVFCSIEDTEAFEVELGNIAGISYIKMPCPAFNEDGIEVEVLDIINGKFIIDDVEKARSVAIKDVIFDKNMGYYIIKKLSEEQEEDNTSLKTKVAENVERLAANATKDKFDFL